MSSKKQRMARNLKQLAQDLQDLKKLEAERISIENELLLLNHTEAVRRSKYNFN